MHMHADQTLDARGLSCPLPVLRIKKALSVMASGQVLKMVATDAGSIKDMEAYTRQTGHELLSCAVEGKEYIFFIKKR